MIQRFVPPALLWLAGICPAQSPGPMQINFSGVTLANYVGIYQIDPKANVTVSVV